jgi:hypothetical protein
MTQVLRMKKSASGPEGSRTAGYEYAVPGNIALAEAEELVAAGSAEWIEGAIAPTGPSPGG